jgi:uncharacterized BrkB/YihY/UPF0761 family membrane protein
VLEYFQHLGEICCLKSLQKILNIKITSTSETSKFSSRLCTVTCRRTVLYFLYIVKFVCLLILACGLRVRNMAISSGTVIAAAVWEGGRVTHCNEDL